LTQCCMSAFATFKSLSFAEVRMVTHSSSLAIDSNSSGIHAALSLASDSNHVWHCSVGSV
ncbi:MAG: hypothetical protein ACKPKO_00485, partial [Candidatus Fonsibacter sp.]